MSEARMVGPMPQIGFGTWNRTGNAAYQSVLWALETGYRHVDTAESYGNEAEVGRAIADSGVPRGEVFLTTKVAPESFGPGQVRPHVEASLEKLRTDKVDLLLLHYPSIGDEYAIEDYMAQFADIHDGGLARHVGVSNFTKRYIDRAKELLGERAIATNQVEIHVFMQNRPIVDYCRAKGIPLTAYSPLARGAVSESEVLKRIASAHEATPGQVALAFLLYQGVAIVPSSGNRDRIAENFAAQDLDLSDEEIRQIRELDEGRRLVNGPWCPAWDR